MKKVLLLATGWEPDYWESDKEAPYPKLDYRSLPDWEDLSRNCPLPGIGRYIKQKGQDFSSNLMEQMRCVILSPFLNFSRYRMLMDLIEFLRPL